MLDWKPDGKGGFHVTENETTYHYNLQHSWSIVWPGGGVCYELNGGDADEIKFICQTHANHIQAQMCRAKSGEPIQCGAPVDHSCMQQHQAQQSKQE